MLVFLNTGFDFVIGNKLVSNHSPVLNLAAVPLFIELRNSKIESPEKVDYQLFSPFIANEAKQKYKKQAIIFFKGQIISEFYQRLNTHLPQNV